MVLISVDNETHAALLYEKARLSAEGKRRISHSTIIKRWAEVAQQ